MWSEILLFSNFELLKSWQDPPISRLHVSFRIYEFLRSFLVKEAMLILSGSLKILLQILSGSLNFTATRFFQDLWVSWLILGLKHNVNLFRIIENLVSNPGRILQFHGYTFLSGISRFLREKEWILVGSWSYLERIWHWNVKDFP